jgi:putative acetyltransferase
MTARRGRAARAVLVRAGRPADAAAIARVMRAAVRGLPAGACTPRQRAAWSSLPALYHRWAMGPGRERYVVAERAGRVVGYAAHRIEVASADRRRRPGNPARPRREAELTAVFVVPAAGGAGIGSALVRAVERRVRRVGADAISALAARSAVGFYAALGFTPGRPARSPLPGGARLPALRMRRPIAAAERAGRGAAAAQARAVAAGDLPPRSADRPAARGVHRRPRPG